MVCDDLICAHKWLLKEIFTDLQDLMDPLTMFSMLHMKVLMQHLKQQKFGAMVKGWAAQLKIEELVCKFLQEMELGELFVIHLIVCNLRSHEINY